MKSPSSHGVSAVVIEQDPTPLVMSLARTMRHALREVSLREQISRLEATIALRSSAGWPSATVQIADGRIDVRRGADLGAHHLLIWRDGTEYELVDAPVDPAVDAIRVLLDPPLPDWRCAADEFWALTGNDPGMPKRLILEATDHRSDERSYGADGADRVVLAGAGEQLAATLSGRGDLFSDLYAGRMSFEGDLPQLSVLCGAHRKVKFHG